MNFYSTTLRLVVVPFGALMSLSSFQEDIHISQFSQTASQKKVDVDTYPWLF